MGGTSSSVHTRQLLEWRFRLTFWWWQRIHILDCDIQCWHSWTLLGLEITNPKRQLSKLLQPVFFELRDGDGYDRPIKWRIRCLQPIQPAATAASALSGIPNRPSSLAPIKHKKSLNPPRKFTTFLSPHRTKCSKNAWFFKKRKIKIISEFSTLGWGIWGCNVHLDGALGFLGWGEMNLRSV
jgi:hypothetical protein